MDRLQRTRKKQPATNLRTQAVRADSAAVKYDQFLGDIAQALETARRSATLSVNAVMSATYWEIGRGILDFEQGGKTRAQYGQALLKRLSGDLTRRFGRSFGVDNLQRFRAFYLAYPPSTIHATLWRNSSPEPIAKKSATPPRISTKEFAKDTLSPQNLSLAAIAKCFPLPWSAYVHLLAVKSEHARRFYETEALRGGWSVRQLEGQQ